MTHLPAVVTADWLSDRGACASAVADVREEWPDGTPITVESLHRATELGIQWGWLVQFLPAPALAEYKRVRAAAWAEYERVRDATFVAAWAS